MSCRGCGTGVCGRKVEGGPGQPTWTKGQTASRCKASLQPLHLRGPIQRRCSALIDGAHGPCSAWVSWCGRVHPCVGHSTLHMAGVPLRRAAQSWTMYAAVGGYEAVLRCSACDSKQTVMKVA